jgi:hypothetical protein
VNLSGLHHEETAAGTVQVAASVAKFTGAGLDQAELIFFMPVTRDRTGDTDAAPQIQAADVRRAPGFNNCRLQVCLQLITFTPDSCFSQMGSSIKRMARD